MAKILISGIATLDIINHVDHYPAEDEELRALSQDIRRGGNAANTSSILAQYGHHCVLAATVTDDMGGHFIQQDLHQRGIKLPSAMLMPGHATPTSYITLNQASGSRTIVHHRDLPEISLEQFQHIKLHGFDWFHFEGRNVNTTAQMMQLAMKQEKTISLEVEKPREQIEQLLPLADVLLFSRPYVESQGYNHAEPFLQQLATDHPNQIISCTWGAQGAWLTQHGKLYHSPAFVPAQVVDTIAAGDTYNAALIHALVEQLPLQDVVTHACQLAGKKCGQHGLEELVQP